MFFFIVLIFLAIVIPIALIDSATRNTRIASEGESIYQGDVDEARAAFCMAAFDLKPLDLIKMHFDGYAVHIKTSKKVSLEHISEIKVVSESNVNVLHPDLPKTTRWKYQRVDGGPDRRYNNNTPTHTSHRTELEFNLIEGETNKFIIYTHPDYPHEITQRILPRFQNLLIANQKFELDKVMLDYSTHYTKKKELLNQIEQIKISIKELENVNAASRYLRDQNVQHPAVNAAAFEVCNALAANASKIQTLTSACHDEDAKMLDLTTKIRNMCVLYANTQVVGNYVSQIN